MTQEQALAILKTGTNVFLTGEPGSGKTHTINEYVAYLRGRGIEPTITASTGIAATHIGGMTIHSWTGIGIRNELTVSDLNKISTNKYVTKRIRAAHVLIIDEVSMLTPELLAMVETVCRKIRQLSTPFGGLQVVLVGDFFQLPPVSRGSTKIYNQDELFTAPALRFAYESPVWERAQLAVCYLTEQHRQDDPVFLELLTAIRKNNFKAEHLSHLETRRIKIDATPQNITKLYSHNADVDRVNEATLAKIIGKPAIFTSTAYGSDNLVEALKRGCLSPEKLSLKLKAVVMFTKNNPIAGFVNGTVGVVHEFDKNFGFPIVKLLDGRKILTTPMDWTIEENGEIRASITQVPLRLAWAITVHKSQGMSLDEAVMDLREVFEYGQGYVALSRVRRLSGLFLLGWNERTFQVHPDVLIKDTEFHEASQNSEKVLSAISSEDLLIRHRKFVEASGGNTDAIVIKPLLKPKPKLKKSRSSAGKKRYY